jgi:hypothetical protein
MDKSTIVLLVLLAVLALYLLYPVSSSSENFVNEGNNVSDPKSYEPNLNREIDESSFVGLPDKLVSPWANNPNEYGKVDVLDDGMSGNAGLNFNMCSKSCCSPQYSPPFPMGSDPLICNSNDEFVSSSYKCNNGWQDSGCLCMTKEQALFMNKRGNNG